MARVLTKTTRTERICSVCFKQIPAKTKYMSTTPFRAPTIVACMECGSKPSFGETNSRKKALFYAQESAYISIECNIVEDIIDALRQAVSDAEDVCSEYDDVIGNVPENFADRISELEEGKEATESWIVVLEDAISEIETINEETSDEENENEEEEDLIDRAKTLATDAISALEI